MAAIYREVVFKVETLDGGDPIEVRFSTAKHEGSLWKEVYDRIHAQIRDAGTGDRIYRIEQIVN